MTVIQVPSVKCLVTCTLVITATISTMNESQISNSCPAAWCCCHRLGDWSWVLHTSVRWTRFVPQVLFLLYTFKLQKSEVSFSTISLSFVFDYYIICMLIAAKWINKQSSKMRKPISINITVVQTLVTPLCIYTIPRLIAVKAIRRKNEDTALGFRKALQ